MLPHELLRERHNMRQEDDLTTVSEGFRGVAAESDEPRPVAVWRLRDTSLKQVADNRGSISGRATAESCEHGFQYPWVARASVEFRPAFLELAHDHVNLVIGRPQRGVGSECGRVIVTLALPADEGMAGARKPDGQYVEIGARAVRPRATGGLHHGVLGDREVTVNLKVCLDQGHGGIHVKGLLAGTLNAS